MAGINPEMLKQLLLEFEEKELVTREEINAINEQIKELEKRIESSKERLQSVAKDREKIGQMKTRYAEGDWSGVLSQLIQRGNGKEEPSSKTALQQPAQQAVQQAQPVNQLANEIVAAQTTAKQETQEITTSREVVLTQGPAVRNKEVVTYDQLPAAQEDQQEAAPAAAASQAQAQQPAAEAAQPVETPPTSGLFSFSQNPQQVQEQAQGDIPWAPPPSMTWESVGSHSTFPTPDASYQPYQPQQPAYQQAPLPAQQYSDPNQAAYQQYAQAQAQQYQQQPQPVVQQPDPNAYAQQQQQPQSQPQPQQQPQQQVLTNAFDEEFDISDALRSEDDQGQDKGSESDKKIKDALRGLFS